MYEVRSHYSFWDEPDRKYKRCFPSVWEAYDYVGGEDSFDTSHEIFRVLGLKEQRLSLMFLRRNYKRRDVGLIFIESDR